MPEPKRRRSIRLPPQVYDQLWLTAHVAGLPLQEVIQVALAHFSGLDHASKVGIVGSFWYRGDYGPEPRGPKQRLRPVVSPKGGWRGLVRAGLARLRRWLGWGGGTASRVAGR